MGLIARSIAVAALAVSSSAFAEKANVRKEVISAQGQPAYSVALAQAQAAINASYPGLDKVPIVTEYEITNGERGHVRVRLTIGTSTNRYPVRIDEIGWISIELERNGDGFEGYAAVAPALFEPKAGL